MSRIHSLWKCTTGTLVKGLLLVGLAIPALPQVNTATLLGQISDVSGAVVQTAQVSATNLETNLKRLVATDAIGAYRIEALPIGRYTLSVTAAGFKTEAHSGIVLAAGDQVRIDFSLAPGAVSDRVDVSGDAGLVNTESSEIGAVTTPQKVESLPLNGRNFTQLVLLEPGVQSASVNGRTSFNINGSTQWGLNIALDGTDASFQESTTFGDPSGNSLLNTVSVDSIQEFRVQSSTFSAETGRSSGGAINIITKSGTNEFHGSLYEYFQNDLLNARNFFAATKNELRQNQFGGTLGGPIRRNRLFFFGNYEEPRRIVGRLLSGLVPSAAFRASAPAVYQSYLQLLPLPTGPLSSPNAGLAYRNDALLDNEKVYNIRADYVQDRSTTMLRYSQNQSSNSVPYLMASNRQDFTISNQLATLDNTYNLTPSTLNEFRLGFNHWVIPRLNSTFNAGVANSISVPSLISDGNFEGDLRFADTSYDILDTVGHQSGKHSLKAGFELRRLQSDRIQKQNPAYSYNTIADFLANTPASVRIIFGTPGIGLRQWQSGFFFQDDWHASSRVTVNLGLRYEYFTVPAEVAGRFYNVVSNPFGPFGSRGAPIYSPDRTDFEPRVGLAWDITGKQKTVIRSGFGVYKSPITPFAIFNLANVSPLEPFAFNATVQDIPGLTYPVSGGVAAAIANPSLAPQLGLLPAVEGRLIVDPHLRDTYTLMWNFSIQQALAKNFMLQTAYVGSHTLKAYDTESLNVINPATGFRPDPAIGEIVITQDDGRRIYDALQVSLQKRLSYGLFADAYYTYSHTLIYGGDDCCSGSTNNNVENYSNIAASRGDAGTDIRHQITFDYGWDIPFFRRNASRLLRETLGGWAVQGITNIRSGQALNIVTGADIAGDGDASSQRVNYLGGPVYGSPQTLGNWFNKAAFALPANGTYGNIGMDVARGPISVNFDTAFVKNVSLWHEHQLMFRADLFNIFNHSNFGNPNTTLTSPLFGQITSASSPRVVQLALKYRF
jgi:outer membrane receptor protein involved in Fe transport